MAINVTKLPPIAEFVRFDNLSNSNESFFYGDDDSSTSRDSYYLIIPITMVYATIFITGFIGNISTCLVIAKNKNMHTATNYYLFSLAVSDFLLLVSGVPMELYHIWYKSEYIFGETFCIMRNLTNEMSANATVLTITAFTIERYFAICHPFLSHTMSKLSRAVKYIFMIWILSVAFGLFQAIQTGLLVTPHGTFCTVLDERELIKHSFELATLLFFFAPMTLITVLYILIGVKLRSSTLIARENGSTMQRNNNVSSTSSQQTSQSTKRVLKMLVAVVLCFFLCWAPFHFQRLAYSWTIENHVKYPFIHSIFIVTTYISGILYYVSTSINPLLYNIMSNKFRQAFKETLQKKCCTCASAQTNYQQKRQYRILSRSQRRYGCQPEQSELSGSGKDDYSSSTQKQSVDTIALSRNTSLKQQHQLHHHCRHSSAGVGVDSQFGKSPSSSAPFTLGLASLRYANGEENDLTNCSTCLPTRSSNSMINIFSDCNINEIHLNIFPPSAAYVKPSFCNDNHPSAAAALDSEKNYLHINVQQTTRNQSKPLKTNGNDNNNDNDDCDKHEVRRKSLSEHFSHISFKRSDSILHISIGSTSKIAKRSKRKLWKFSKLWHFSGSSARKASQRKHHQIFLATRLDGNGDELDARNGCLNLINDDLMITVNKRHCDSTSAVAEQGGGGHHHSSSVNGTMSEQHQNQLKLMERELMENLLKCNDAINSNGTATNELDCYMDEIKRREWR